MPRTLPRDSAANRLLQQVRDEAHRFALAFNRREMARLALPDPLLGIPGLGPVLKERLLLRFGDVKRLGEASLDELVEVKGVGRKLAVELLEKLKCGNGSVQDPTA
jgi:excinuclease ABC subunit C